MSFIKPVKNSFVLCVIEHFQSSLRDFLSPKKVSKSFCNSWNDFFLLDLVIEDGNFFTIWVFELRSDKRVAGDDGASFRKSKKECSWDERSCNEHSCIWDLFVSSSGVVAVFLYFSVSHEHVHSRDSVLGENCVTVVLVVVAVFGADIACFDSGEKFVALVSDRDQKRMDAVFLVVDDEVGEDNCVVGVDTQIADPPFGACSAVAVNDEILWVGVISCGGHEALNIWAVA